jgi:proteasome lid subunit RPN8/RPN11
MSAEDHWYVRPLREVHRVALPLFSTATRTIRELSAAAHPRETGGLLLGWWDQCVPVVRAAFEVSDPRAGHNRWTRHEDSATAALAAALAASHEPRLGYIGEWHSHPADIGPAAATSASFDGSHASTRSPSSSRSLAAMDPSTSGSPGTDD